MKFPTDLTKRPGRPRIRVMQPADIGILIRQERQARGWSLWHLAELCGKSAQTISAIELGESKNPQLGTVIPICDALQVPREKVYDLLSPKEASPRQPPANGRKARKATAPTS